MMTDHISTECVVIGAGVIGLAVARYLTLAGKEVVVVDKAEHIGSGISSRNSEVIHAGIYYPSSSLKAQLCLRGKRLLYDYCDDYHVPYKRLGKLIVAVDQAEHSALVDLMAQGQANGVEGLSILSRADAMEQEPELSAYSALMSSTTGIVDSQALMLSLLGEIESASGMLALNTQVVEAKRVDQQWLLTLIGNSECQVSAVNVINCTGFDAIDFAKNIQGYDHALAPPAYFAKGHYFSLQGASPFNHLIYPLPKPGGLGIHATLDMAGRTRFGPDVMWVDSPDYHFTSNGFLREQFVEAISVYYPAIKAEQLSADYLGVRPKLSRRSFHDFVIQGPKEHGSPGLVHCFGIESPGLTASLAIGEYIAHRQVN